MPLVIEGHANNLVLYADDANIIFTGENFSDIEFAASLEMTKISQFLSSSNLLLNVNKTNFISFKTRQNRSSLIPNIILDNYTVEQLTDTKFLGLIVDSNLSWDDHIRFLSKKLSSSLYALRRMKHFCNFKTLKMIYSSIFQSHILYGLSIYGGTSKKNLEIILGLQKKAIRIMLSLKFNDSVKNYFKELGILTIFDLYIFETVKYCKQNHITNLNESSHGYNTRNKFTSERHNLELYKKKTTYAGSKFLQYIPKDIVNENNYNRFLLKLKSYLSDISCYSLEEFYQHAQSS